MDNITHSLAGALAGKMIQPMAGPELEKKAERRTLFWLLVLTANLPDIDGLLNFLGDPILSIKHHRGITHSILFAPLFAFLPAALFFLFGRVKNLRLLWFVSLLGILVHIFFDLITPFGTQILAPFSSARFSLDWIFIIDPFLTGILVLTLGLMKIFAKNGRFITFVGIGLVGVYLLLGMILQNRAHAILRESLRQNEIVATRTSAFPQPLSMFKWMGLAETPDGVVQTFFSVLSDEHLHLTNYEHAKGIFVEKALKTEEAAWYKTFARYPWIQSGAEGDHRWVEFRDLQFSIDRGLLRWLGITDRPPPFVMRYDFSVDGSLIGIYFNNRKVIRE